MVGPERAQHGGHYRRQVTNGTTGKRSAGDEVVLTLATGTARVIGRGRTDARGRFQFTIAHEEASYLVCAVHQDPGAHLIL